MSDDRTPSEPVRRPRAWLVTVDGRDKHEALFLSLPRALEYAVMHHGQVTELYE